MELHLAHAAHATVPTVPRAHTHHLITVPGRRCCHGQQRHDSATAAMLAAQIECACALGYTLRGGGGVGASRGGSLEPAAL